MASDKPLRDSHEYHASDQISGTQAEGDPASHEASSARSAGSTPSDSGGERKRQITIEQQVGPYLIRAPHGKGGQGEVVIAFDPVLKRNVAIKLIRSDRQTLQSRQRLRNEAEITAQLAHAGIVPVYFGGQDESGDPFFAMRFVEGETFAQAIEAHHKDRTLATLRELLQRVLAVCDTVSYVHSQGILHRDLKPSNVQLGKYGETWVLDWGLAKEFVRAQRHHEPSITLPGRTTELETVSTCVSHNSVQAEQGKVTLEGQIPGTPTYMAPEQADVRSLRLLGPRADVYGLGAILYELLAGRAPYLGSAAEVLVRLAETPPLPLLDAKPAPPAGLARSRYRALIAVCAKAMHRDLGKRYSTVEEFRKEVQDWLNDDPVSAFPDPITDRIARTTKRHLTIVVSAIALLATIVLSLLVVLYFVDQSRRGILEAKTETAKERDAAQRAATTNESINEFWRDRVLFQASPVNNPIGAKITLMEILDKASKEIESMKDQPETESAIRYTMGRTYIHLGQYDIAEAHLLAAQAGRRATLGATHRLTLTTDVELGSLRYFQKRLDDAEVLLSEALQKAESTLIADDLLIFTIKNVLASVLRDKGEKKKDRNLIERAGALYQQSFDGRKRQLAADHEDVLQAQSNLAAFHSSFGDQKVAEEMLNETIDGCGRRFGDSHPFTLTVKSNLAFLLRRQKRPAEAEVIANTVVLERKHVLGRQHPETLKAMDLLIVMEHRVF